ncbi:MAG: ABC transporter substrate-binding protein, partial [Candidatus Dormibacteraceae bacterium]
QVPDVANPGVGSISPFIAQNGLLPLDKYFDSWKGKSDFAGNVIASVRSVAPDKKLYAMPYSANLNVLYYRKDLVDQAGLPSPGTSWSNFYKVAAALTKPNQGIYGFGLRGGSGSVATIESWLYAATGINTFFDSKGHATLDKPQMVSALERWVGMYGKDTSKSDLNNEYRAMAAEFDSGHAAMIFHNLGSYPGHVTSLGASKVGVTVLPPAPNGKTTLEGLSYLGNVILRGSKHPEQAWTFVAYLSAAAAQSYFNQQIGQIPADKKAADEPWVKQNAAAQAAKTALAGKNAVIVSPPLYLPAYSTTQVQMEPALQKVLIGQLSAQSFLQQWASQLNTALSQFKKAHGNH